MQRAVAVVELIASFNYYIIILCKCTNTKQIIATKR